MICPHCDRNLLRRERTDRRCTHCHRTFALEPKENTLRLHDNRVSRLAERLGEGGRLRYTLPQLWYAAARGRLPGPADRYEGCGCISFAVTAGAVVVVSGFLELRGERLAQAIAAGVAVFAVVLTVLSLAARRARRRAPIRVPMEPAEFEALVRERWVEVYGAPPAGLVPAGHDAYGGQGAYAAAGPPVDEGRVVAAVVCPVPAVLACLAANDVARAHAVLLCEAVEAVPPGLPAVVLHDASPPGVVFAAAARRALGGRAVVAGLAPRAVLPAPTGTDGADEAGGPGSAPVAAARQARLRLRERPLTEPEVARLRAQAPELTAAELAWLAAGWWFPLAAVPPAKLLEVVATGVRRARERVDPDRRRARAVGFLSWPAEPGRPAGPERQGAAT